jgi:hypothetical protein
MANEARRVTRRLIEIADEGLIDWESLARDCMNYMSEHDVADMAYCNGYMETEQEECEE